jgi:hypothetical protein
LIQTIMSIASSLTARKRAPPLRAREPPEWTGNAAQDR